LLKKRAVEMSAVSSAVSGMAGQGGGRKRLTRSEKKEAEKFGGFKKKAYLCSWIPEGVGHAPPDG